MAPGRVTPLEIQKEFDSKLGDWDCCLVKEDKIMFFSGVAMRSPGDNTS